MPTVMQIDVVPAFVEYEPEDDEFQGLASAKVGAGTVSVSFRGRSVHDLQANFRDLWPVTCQALAESEAG